MTDQREVSSTIKTSSEIAGTVFRISRIGFFFVIVVLFYLFLPWQEIAFLATTDHVSSENLRNLIFVVTQKVFFLGISVFLLMQFRSLLEDLLLQRQQIQIFKLPSSADRADITSEKTLTSSAVIISPEESESAAEEQLSEMDVRPLDYEKVFRNFRGRMKTEYRRLKAISTRNLSIGIGFSLAALFFIAYPLVFAAAAQDTVGTTDQQMTTAVNWLVRYYVPRLAVGLLLQFVGFFFLRLYVANEQDIKHTSNEMTNLEAKMMGLLVASGRPDKSLIKSMVDSLAKTERNFVLKKNERTILQDEDRKYNDLKDIILAFPHSIFRGHSTKGLKAANRKE